MGINHANTILSTKYRIQHRRPDKAKSTERGRSRRNSLCRSRLGSSEGQDVVSAYIIDEWRQQGGEEIAFPDDISRARQKLFRYLDNPAESERYHEYVRLLTPAIMAVLPLEFRHRLMPQDDILSRLSSAMKECAEAKQAVMLNAPEHQKLKEVSEGIASLFRLMPEQTGTLMTIVSSMLGVM